MDDRFFEQPVLNSPYEYPSRHWELDAEGQMLQRVMPELMGIKRTLVLNDEAHHCYREKPGEGVEGDLKGDDREDAGRCPSHDTRNCCLGEATRNADGKTCRQRD